MTIGLIARSAALLSMATRPSSRKSVKAGQRFESIAHRVGQIAFAGNAQELCFAPDPECVDQRPTMALPDLPAHLGGFAGDVAFDVVKGADPIERFLGNR